MTLLLLYGRQLQLHAGSNCAQLVTDLNDSNISAA